MASRDQMLIILRTAEEALAELAAEAGKRRMYTDAAALLEAARRVQQIGESTFLKSGDNADAAPGNTVSGPVPVATRGTPAIARKLRKPDYPKFFREGDTLVKVGWSKSERDEYEHKSPKRVVDALIAQLVRVAEPGRRFVMDKVLPLRDPDSGAELPTYQPYLALAFLRHAGLVEQHGRSGYSIPKPRTLVDDAAGAWGGVTVR